jgi:NADPH:quinone reductase-like Zn-dependent oxidoreductase
VAGSAGSLLRMATLGEVRAIIYKVTGGLDVLSLTNRPVPEPGPGEARVQVAASGVNPTDWKAPGRRPGSPRRSPRWFRTRTAAG